MIKINGLKDRETYNFVGKLNAVGRDGVGLDFHWDGTKLGIKKGNEDEFEYVDLKGDTKVIDDITKEHIVNILGYEPLDASNLDELEATVDGHTVKLTELIDLLKTKASIEDIPTKLSELEKDIELGGLTSEELQNINDMLQNLDDAKASVEYIDNAMLELESNLGLDISEISRELSTIKTEITEFNESLESGLTSLNDTLDNKADIIHTHKEYEDDILSLIAKVQEVENKIESIDIPEGVDLTPVLQEIKLLKETKANMLDIPNKLSELDNDKGYITIDDIPAIDLGDIEKSISNINTLLDQKADKNKLNNEIDILHMKVDNLNIPEEVDLTDIKDDIESLKNDKADKTSITATTQHIMNQLMNEIVKKANTSFVESEISRMEGLIDSIEIPDEVDLSPIQKDIESLKSIKSDKAKVQSEIDRLEKMIGELAGGGEIDLSEYAKKKDLPKQLSELGNDAGFITIADIPKVDLTEINNKLLKLQEDKANKIDVLNDIANLQIQISDLDIPEEVDLTPINETLEDLKLNKVDVTKLQSEISKVNGSLSTFREDIGRDYARKTSIPTSLSELSNDSGYITISDVPKVDLKDIENSIEKLDIEKANKTDILSNISDLQEQINTLDIPEKVDLEPINKAIKLLQDNKVDVATLTSEILKLNEDIKLKYATLDNIPKSTSQLNNDSGYITISDVPKVDTSEIEESIESIQGKLDEHGLELETFDGDILLVKSNLANKVDKTYVDTRLNGHYQKSETYTRDEINKRIADIIGNAPENLDTLEKLAVALDNDESFASSITKEVSNKVDKVDGKILSSNDFTNTYKLKLDSIEENANKVEKLSELINDKGYITLAEVPKFDTTIIEKDIELIKEDMKKKANQTTVDTTLQHIMNQLMNEVVKRVEKTYVDEQIAILETSKADMESLFQLQNHIESMSEITQNKADLGYVEKEVIKLNNLIKDIDIPDLKPITLDLESLKSDKANKEHTHATHDIDGLNTWLDNVEQNKANKNEIETQISKLKEQIENIDVPEGVDLSPIESELKLIQTKLSKLDDNKVNKSDLDVGVVSINDQKGELEMDAYNIPINSHNPSWTINDELNRKASSYELSNIKDSLGDKANKVEIPYKLSDLENDLDLGGGSGVTSINDLKGDIELDAYSIPMNIHVPSWTIQNELDRKASSYELEQKADTKHSHSISDIDQLDEILLPSISSRTSTIVIANYDSHENSKRGADIVIQKGENAATKINDVIQSLKGVGGEVKLMEGNYNLEHGIAVNIDNVHLTGIPNATILVQNSYWKGNPYSNNSKYIIDTTSNNDNLRVTISNLYLNGDKVSGSSGFYCSGNSQIINCTSVNSRNYGFYCDGNSRITNCTSTKSGLYGFYCTTGFVGVCSFNTIESDRFRDFSSHPAATEYNLVKGG